MYFPVTKHVTFQWALDRVITKLTAKCSDCNRLVSIEVYCIMITDIQIMTADRIIIIQAFVLGQMSIASMDNEFIV